MRAPSLPALVPAISGGAWVKNSETQTILIFLPKAAEEVHCTGDKREDGMCLQLEIQDSDYFFLRNGAFVTVLEYSQLTNNVGVAEIWIIHVELLNLESQIGEGAKISSRNWEI